MRYDVRLTPAAIRDLDRISPRYVGAIVEFAYGALADYPHRVGKPLRQELEGLHAARRGDYRVLYEINDDQVLVHRVDHRSRVYRTR
ncbi:MAG: type II toxin-antitoxin system RelE family toxin [Nocardioidaceae bacterium]